MRLSKTLGCPHLPRVGPLPCLAPPLTFSVASGSSVLTEVYGPQLSPAEEFVYDGSVYTVMTVNPGASQFTAFVNNALFVNDGAAITDARVPLVCG